MRIYAVPLAAPELAIAGHFWTLSPVPGPLVEGVGAGVVAAAKRAAAGLPAVLAEAAVVRETTPIPSPVSPRAVAPTTSNRWATLFI
ncbi:MAG TPA: hypothetical protein VMV12_07400 [Candidatus Micrarchaeaceae archaeon]|nr:hypothetical protein [Candidatus Micrarchaeaceae archaeon]